jgi:cell division transport system permease protein
VSWRPSGDLTVFLAAGEPVERAIELADALHGRPEVAETEVKSADDALAELREMSDFAEALGALDANPMPALVIVRLTAEGVARTRGFQSANWQRAPRSIGCRWTGAGWSGWTLLDSGAAAVILLGAAILAVAVLLVVGNTIRLEISLKREEILILKLLGASDGHVRRPFLYIGVWYGIDRRLARAALVHAGLQAVQPALDRLALSYEAGVCVAGARACAARPCWSAYGALLGWLGAWLASARHLRDAEPR